MTISQVEEGNDSHFHVSIPELTPLIANQSSRSIKAVVTLVWPYSSATKTVALLLAEPDFRLRRKRGQVRTQFQGSIAEAVATSGIGSGDEIVLSLEGAEFVHNAENIVGTPGRGVDFELKYTHRLVLKVRTGSIDRERELILLGNSRINAIARSRPRVCPSNRGGRDKPEAFYYPRDREPNSRGFGREACKQRPDTMEVTCLWKASRGPFQRESST